MRELDWFVETLEQNHAVKVNRNHISYEGNELYLDEVDESFIPHEMAEALPEKLLFETMMFDDEDGTEWIGAIAFRPNSPEWLLQILVKDGEPVLRKFDGEETE